MGKTKKRQAKRAAVEAARQEQVYAASSNRVGSALAAGGGGHGSDARDSDDPRWISARDNTDDPDNRFRVAPIKLKVNPMAGVIKPKAKQKTGIMRITRAVEAAADPSRRPPAS